MADEASWWTIRPAQSRKPTTYRCPFCRKPILPMTPHALIAPAGDMTRRRHAHMECVRRAGLNTKRPKPPRRGWLSRLRARGG